jgi:hypothetical protein
MHHVVQVLVFGVVHETRWQHPCTVLVRLPPMQMKVDLHVIL